MDQIVINATTRTETGKAAAKRLRAAGRLPAVMYDGAGKAVLVDLDAKEFSKLFHRISESTLIDMKLDGSKDLIAFVKDVQYDIIKDTVGHIDLYHVDPAKVLRTRIPIKLTGTPAAVRSGGVLEASTTEIEVECLPRDLPERITVDCTNLEANHSLHVKDITVPPKVKVLTDGGRTIASVKYVKG
jgi:large subunit ribosomal protein L25